MSHPEIPEHLRAKSARNGLPALRLDQHLRDTEEAARLLFRRGTRWAGSWRRFFRLSEADDDRCFLNLRIAALFHDLGKANVDFYTATGGGPPRAQTIRHEHLSALVLQLEEIQSWLEQNPALEHAVISAAVLSHHIKADSDGTWAWCQPNPAGHLPVATYLQHPEVVRTLETAAQIAQLGPPPALPGGNYAEEEPWSLAQRQGRALGDRLRRQIRRDADLRRRLVTVKAGVIVADSVASGIVRVGDSIPDWIEEVSHAASLESSELFADIIGPRMEALSVQQRKPFELHEFQKGAAQLGPRALLLAACGSGKTLAGWKWAEAQARARPIGRVIFLYPTRGTATEGFRDYVGWAPEDKASLVHATARYELADMRANPPESMVGKDFNADEQNARLFALGLWPRRYFSATVDRFLSFMEHGYESLCLLPALADSVVIIDEVHSFDRHMFDVLIAFLRNFDVPVLCMTATLPRSRRHELEAAGLEVYPTAEDATQLSDLHEQEAHPRYHIDRLSSEDAAFAIAVASYRAGQRVLWVVNVVRRCQALAQRLSAELGPGVLCYHSRFRLMDRRQRHADTIEAFRQRSHPAVAVTTQVCEMSLDLDADVLLSEIAPVSALVQRFGRANRHRARGDAFRAKVGVYTPHAAAPYEREDLTVAEGFVDRFTGKDASQLDLATALEELARSERTADGSAAFLDKGLYAVPGSLRDSDDSAACLLDGDLEAYLQARRARSPSEEGFLLTAPAHACLPAPSELPADLPRYLRFVPAAQYRPDLGLVIDRAAP